MRIDYLKLGLLSLIACLPVAATGSGHASVRLVPVAKGWAGNSINANILRHNSLVSHEGEQYIAFYDTEGRVVLGKRSIGSANWTLSPTDFNGNVRDAHNVISIMVDGDGYLHLSWDHHGHPLRYCRSRAPGSLEMGPMESMVGDKENRVTYPEFYRLPDGDLLFLYRDGSSGRGDLMMNYYDLNSREWTRRQDAFINGEGERNPYWQLCIDDSGTIHVSWVWRETGNVATNHDMGYARSRDRGLTWERSNGERYHLPIVQANAEYAARIPQAHELINTTSMAADQKGNPYIATYWRPVGEEVPQYHLIHHDGQAWHTVQVSERQTPFSLSGGGTKRIPISRCRILADARSDRTRAYLLFRDVERGSRVSLAQTNDLERGDWTFEDLTDYSVDMWEPSYDTELWRTQRSLHIFVQRVEQGDGERVRPLRPQMVYVLELDASDLRD